MSSPRSHPKVEITPYPWITQLYIFALKFHQNTYGRLPNCSFQITISPDNIPCLSSPKLSLSSAIFLLTLYALEALGIYVHCTWLLKPDNEPLTGTQIVQIGVSIAYLSWGLQLCIIVRHEIMRGGALYANALNQLIQEELSINVQKPFVSDYCGCLLLYLMIGCSIFGLPAGFILRYVDVDTWLMIFQRLNLAPDSAFSWIISLALSSLQLIFGVRDLIVFCFTVFATLLAVEGHLKALEQHKGSFQDELNVVREYSRLKLLYDRVAGVTNNMSMQILVFSQIILTTFLWISINCVDIVPLFITAATSAAFVGGLGLAWFYLHLNIFVRIQSEDLIDSKRKMFKVSGQDGYLKRLWRAQQILPINCGTKFGFSRDSLQNYVVVLTDNFTNALLLIKV